MEGRINHFLAEVRCYNGKVMPTGKEYLDAQFLEMRSRVLSLAADLDRIERSAGGAPLLESDPRIQNLRRAMKAVLDERGNRAEQVQMLFSDLSG
jgi:hypothetical protein